jgi:hypothetical protein
VKVEIKPKQAIQLTNLMILKKEGLSPHFQTEISRCEAVELLNVLVDVVLGKIDKRGLNKIKKQLQDLEPTLNSMIESYDPKKRRSAYRLAEKLLISQVTKKFNG